jgi:hypothetical protein
MFFHCPLELLARQRLNAMNDIGPDNARRLLTSGIEHDQPLELPPASV